jgi:hypothetical protein
MALRTLKFLGKAYGTEPVKVTAHINNQLVFEGLVPTLISVDPATDDTNFGTLFTVENTSLFPTSFAGTYPMTLSSELGDIQVNNVFCNYTPGGVISGASKITGTINGRTLTISSIEASTTAEFTTAGGADVSDMAHTSDMAQSGTINQLMIVTGGIVDGAQVGNNTYVENGSGNTWILAENQFPLPQGAVVLYGIVWSENTGEADIFQAAYLGTPVNSDGTRDPRTNVVIDGHPQTPARPAGKPGGPWTWNLNDGSTMACDLNVRLGDLGS